MNCGTLKEVVDEKTRRKSYAGAVKLIGVLNGELALMPHPAYTPGKSPVDHPQYLVEYMPRGERAFYEVGAAWIKKLRQSDGEFISITVDMPQWDKPLNLVMFAPDVSRGEKDWRVQWSRPRGGEVDQQQAA